MSKGAMLDRAWARWADPSAPTRALVVCGTRRGDGNCAEETSSKTLRLAELVREVLEGDAFEVDLLHLGLFVSDHDALETTSDWTNEIYERWTAAHAVVIVTPTHWYSMSSALKRMIDRLTCAAGVDPDSTSTHGKNAEGANALELRGGGSPKDLDHRVYGLVVHGDGAAIESSRRVLADWLDGMGLIDAGDRPDPLVWDREPYATNQDELDNDEAVQEEARHVARAVARFTTALRQRELTGDTKQPSRARAREL